MSDKTICKDEWGEIMAYISPYWRHGLNLISKDVSDVIRKNSNVIIINARGINRIESKDKIYTDAYIDGRVDDEQLAEIKRKIKAKHYHLLDPPKKDDE